MDVPQPGDFWFVNPPTGDLTIVEIISRNCDGTLNILPIGMELQALDGWELLMRVVVPLLG